MQQSSLTVEVYSSNSFINESKDLWPWVTNYTNFVLDTTHRLWHSSSTPVVIQLFVIITNIMFLDIINRPVFI
jgi:hypothetical protein